MKAGEAKPGKPPSTTQISPAMLRCVSCQSSQSSSITKPSRPSYLTHSGPGLLPQTALFSCCRAPGNDNMRGEGEEAKQRRPNSRLLTATQLKYMPQSINRCHPAKTQTMTGATDSRESRTQAEKGPGLRSVWAPATTMKKPSSRHIGAVK
ncbi:hypothetical protein VTK56DRAFT_1095 [Thermocarpiscus australiensis]